jgi:hypothetical protein
MDLGDTIFRQSPIVISSAEAIFQNQFWGARCLKNFHGDAKFWLTG